MRAIFDKTREAAKAIFEEEAALLRERKAKLENDHHQKLRASEKRDEKSRSDHTRLLEYIAAANDPTWSGMQPAPEVELKQISEKETDPAPSPRTTSTSHPLSNKAMNAPVPEPRPTFKLGQNMSGDGKAPFAHPNGDAKRG